MVARSSTVQDGIRVVARPAAPLTASAVLALLLAAVAGPLYAQPGPETRPREPIIGGPCEGCEAVFEGLPDELEATARIGAKDEPGEPLRIEGVVFDPDGRPAPGVIVYAYHTDAQGIYPPDGALAGLAAYRHGRLRAWAMTDDRGRYRFDTIRPGSYPDRRTPAHVHMHVIEPGCCTYYIASIHFEDDPLLTPEDLGGEGDRGGGGLVRPERDAEGVWGVRRDILLGEGVPGHPGSGRTRSTR